MTNLSKPNIVTDGLPRHGSPQDRGGADAYYGRGFEPHYYTGHTYQSDRVGAEDMTPAQIEEYRYGYENEEDRKDWGIPEREIDFPTHCDFDTEEE